MRFAVKHAVAAGIVIAGIAASTAALYFALFAAAVIFNQPFGRPVAGPAMVLFAVVASVVAIGIILLPATAFTEWICARRGVRVWWQIPIATAVMGTWLMMLGVIAAAIRGVPVTSTAIPAGVVFLILLVPLGAFGGRACRQAQSSALSWLKSDGVPPVAH